MSQTASLARDLRSAPNLVSLSRVVLLIAAVAVWFSGFQKLGMAFGIIAGLTDYLDGYLARRLNQVTYLGAILDQFSDRLFTTALLLILTTSDATLIPPVWILLPYLVREFWISTIRRFMAAHSFNIESNFLGKLKTNFFGWSFVPWFAHVAGFAPEYTWLWVGLGWTGTGGGLLWSYLSGLDYHQQFVAAYNTLTVDD
jgi:CDP-diacylglycerol--glycerol-3-phosphate 3-phosphatidyltransferase